MAKIYRGEKIDFKPIEIANETKSEEENSMIFTVN